MNEAAMNRLLFRLVYCALNIRVPEVVPQSSHIRRYGVFRATRIDGKSKQLAKDFGCAK